MTDLIGCVVNGCGLTGRVRAVTFNSSGDLMLWIEDEHGELRRIGGSTIRIVKQERPPPTPMPIPGGDR